MTEDQDLEFDLDELIDVLGEPSPSISDVDRQYFWFEYEGKGMRSLTVSLSRYHRRVGVTVSDGDTGNSFGIEECDWVRVLEPELKTIEIVSQKYQTRCFLALDGESVVQLSVGDLEHG